MQNVAEGSLNEPVPLCSEMDLEMLMSSDVSPHSWGPNNFKKLKGIND